jgi:ribosome-binding factor A
MGAFRKEKVARVIRQVVGDAIAHRLNDPRVSPLTTVTRVSVSSDLLNAKVYLTVHGSAVEERQTLRAVQHASGFVQRLVARELTMRHCPDVRFEIDEAAKGTLRTMELLAQNRLREPQLYADDPVDGGSEEAGDDASDRKESSKEESFGVGE